MIEALIARFGLHAAVVLGVVVAFVTWDHSRVNKGRALERATIEKATKDGLKKADSAGRKSADPASPGLRSPYYRD